FTATGFYSGIVNDVPAEDNVVCVEILSDASFDLQENTATILGTQDAADFNISYHGSQDDADNNASPLPLTGYTPSLETETIFVRIENVNKTDCYTTGSFEIKVNTIRIGDLSDVALEECDDDNDASASFNLVEEVDALALAGQDSSAYTVSYYTSQADADLGMSAAV
ncbi:hypothetical protein KW502_15320, partial [Mesonia sp. JHPTF-M18]|nr:hypothetical protein [Mesonia aestuariivivens]